MLKRFAIAAAAVIFCAQIGFAQSVPAWEKFTIKGHFEALYPAKPALEKSEFDAKVFKRQETYTAESDTGFFGVSFSELVNRSADPEGEMKAALEGLQSTGYKFTTETKIAEGGSAGRKFKGVNVVNGYRIHMSGKIFHTGTSLYIVMATVAEEDAASPEIEKFLSSFRILK